MESEAMAVLGTRLAGGDSRAVEDVYEALGPRVLSYLRRRVPYDEAEDVLQRVFFEVWRSRDRFDPGRSLEAWVFAIARRRAIDHLRRPHHVTVPIELVRDLAGADGREPPTAWSGPGRCTAALTGSRPSSGRCCSWPTSAAAPRWRSPTSWACHWVP
jgi:RNA polymerase sigma factor (sigma-70 family)